MSTVRNGDGEVFSLATLERARKLIREAEQAPPQEPVFIIPPFLNEALRRAQAETEAAKPRNILRATFPGLKL